MKEKMRGLLGFLGLVEDDYGDYGPANTPRPFSDQPDELESEWTPTPVAVARTYPQAQSPRPTLRPNVPTRTPMRTAPVSVLEGSSGVRGVRPAASSNPARGAVAFQPDRDVAIVVPENYDDSRQITDYLRQNRAVVLVTLNVEPALTRRLVDFTAGTAYALTARIEMLIRGVYLISPQGMFVGPEMKERLRATNYHALDRA
ncbi:MAG TPA: cell division protein SepF [Acidimicrobiales bacterium]|jgi:FtsZ-interacting cell division protein YlmF